MITSNYSLLPEPNSSIKDGNTEYTYNYLKELNQVINRKFDDYNYGINGTLLTSDNSGSSLWTPSLYGTSTAGTFVYSHQVGWAFRQGIMVDIWFDVQWTSIGGAAGSLYLLLPYAVTPAIQMPFVGVVQPSSVTYTAGTEMVINAIPDTQRGEFWTVGDGVATGNQDVATSTTGRVIGHLRYVGKYNE